MQSGMIAFILLLAFELAGGALAKEAAPTADDPVLEGRVMKLAGQLRCLQCQNQSIAESNAPLAVDIRNEIREQMRRGLGEREIISFLVARYGDFVLLQPPFNATTLLLWLGPVLLLMAGLIGLFYRLLRRRGPTEVQLSEAEYARTAQLLGFGSDKELL